MFKSVKKWLLPLALVLVVAFVFAGCSSTATTTTATALPQPRHNHPQPQLPSLSGSFKIIGSNTVTPLSSVWAENFMKANPKVSIAVSGPGSGVGIAALIDSTTDICQSSRAIKQRK